MRYTKATNLDGTTCYFDYSKATAFTEDCTWSGANKISVNTNQQHAHEELLRTAGGHWILRKWSDWQGSADTCQVIGVEDAYDWLVRNDEEEHVPEEALKAWEAKHVLP